MRDYSDVVLSYRSAKRHAAEKVHSILARSLRLYSGVREFWRCSNTLVAEGSAFNTSNAQGAGFGRMFFGGAKVFPELSMSALAILRILIPVLSIISAIGGFAILKNKYDAGVQREAAYEMHLQHALAERNRFQLDAKKKEELNAELRGERLRSLQRLQKTSAMLSEWRERAIKNEQLQEALDCTLPPDEFAELCEQIPCATGRLQLPQARDRLDGTGAAAGTDGS